MAKSSEISRQVVTYLQGVFTSEVVSIVLGVVARRLLGPVQVGIWSLFHVILTYAKYTSLGTFFAALREIPFYNGKGQTDKADQIKDAVFTFGVVSSAVLSAAVAAYALVFRYRLSPEFFYGLLLVSGLILLRRLNNMLINFLRCYKYFDIASKQMVFSSIVNAVLVSSLCYFFKLYGYILVMCLSFLFNVLYILSYRKFTFRWCLDWERLHPLVLLGLPLMALTMANTIFLTSDKLMIAKFLGLEALGFYNVAVLMATNVANFPNSVVIVLMPNFQEKFGTTENKKDLQGYIEKSSYFFCDTMPYVVAAVYFLGPWLLKLVLPDFMGGARAMQSLAFSAFFLAVDYPYGLFLVAVKKHLSMAKRVAVACVLAIALNFLAIRMGWGLVGIAGATVAALFFKFSANYFLTGRYLYGRELSLRNYLGILAKFVWMAAVIAVLEIILVRMPYTAFKAVLQYGAFFLVYLPALFRLNAEFRVWELFREKLGFGSGPKMADQG